MKVFQVSDTSPPRYVMAHDADEASRVSNCANVRALTKREMRTLTYRPYGASPVTFERHLTFCVRTNEAPGEFARDVTGTK